MNKYLVVKENSGDTYHIFNAQESSKECKVTSNTSCCARVDISQMNLDEKLVSCKALPGTMAILSNTEEQVCPGCVSNVR